MQYTCITLTKVWHNYYFRGYMVGFFQGDRVASMTNRIKQLMNIGLVAFTLTLASYGQTIRISEVMADNGSTLPDEDGSFSDWIELYNPSDAPVALGGWYLTDDPAELSKWTLPATNIAAKGFLLVFASDKDRSTTGAELHTNFKLSASGEYLALVQPDGTSIEDGFTFPALGEDTSFGYAFSGGEIDTSGLGLLVMPTPGQTNSGIAYLGNVETPVTMPERGIFDSPVLVSVSNLTAGAMIHYTLDGSEPTTNSALYAGPIPIAATTCLRTKAFLDGWRPSFSSTHTYIFLDDIISEPRTQVTINNNPIITGMDAGVLSNTYHDASGQICTVKDALLDIPTLSVVTDSNNLFSVASGIYVNPAERWEVPASLELLNPDGSQGFQANAGLRIRGGWSRHDGYAKHAFRLFFKQEYGNGKLNFPLFEGEGVDSFDNMDLRTAMNYNWTLPVDGQEKNTFLRDVFTRDSAGAMGVAYTRSRYYHLYLNGQYWGLYMTEERPEASYAASYFGGDPADYDVIKTTSWTDTTGFNVPPWYEVEATDGTLDAYNRLYTAAMAGFSDNTAYFAIQGLDATGQPDPTQEKLLDVDNLIDYLLLIYYTGASDNGITAFLNALNNLYAVYNRENPDGFKWIQHDCEHALDTSTQLDRTGPFTDPKFQQANYFNPQTLHEKLLANDEYRLLFADHVYKHFKNNGALAQTNCEARLDFRQAQIDRAIIANAARWGSTSLDRNTWLTATASARAFFSGRVDAVIGYLNADGILPSIAPPQINRSSGQVEDGTVISLSASQGTIYFTTDGRDPRAIGGTIGGSRYIDPIAVHEPVQIKARALLPSGEWSALLEASFWIPDVPLAITELMYHAPAGNPYDFIEIRNVSTQTVRLAGYKLDNAIEFKFKNGMLTQLAPNEYMVVVDDLAAFSSTYPTNGILIAGEYSGDLGNGGETVDLEFHGNDLVSFTYSDARNWPQAADGAGHSLVPLDAAMDTQDQGSLDYGGNWRASTYINGSPGQADPVAGPTVLLNEITAHTDTGLAPPFDSNDRIELFNPTATPVTLNDWYLSDDSGVLHKWQIPNGTVVPAYGFMEFDEDDFHPGRISGFGLDKAGEQVILSAPGRVVDAIRFKGQENGTALGRYPDGNADWVTTIPTPASSNMPVAATLQISELMYHPLPPAGNEMEYIQIENVGTTTASFENTTGTYRIDGGVSYSFPAGTTLAAGETLWLVSFDPAIDIDLLSHFRTTYGLSGSDPVYGPYTGELSNRGERVALERPQASDDPLRPLDVSWVVVDELFYFDQAPWPASADGGGHPLIRSGLTSWEVPFTPVIAVPETTIYKRAFIGQAPVESTLEIWNTAVSTLDYSITSNVPWLSISPSSGSSTGELDHVTLNYDAIGLAAGTYTGQLTIAAAGAFNSPQSVDVIMELYEQTLDHFSWEPIGTDQWVDQPFDVSVSARDQHDAIVSSFTNSIPISGLVGGVAPPEIDLGSESSLWYMPLGSSYHDARTQSIYLNNEIGYACTITSLALNVSSIPGQTLGNWTIRMRHTSLSNYGLPPKWESTWTTVYQHTTTITSNGWTVFEFDTPFEYNGTDNLMIDFSFNNTSRTSNGYCFESNANANRTLYYRSNSGYGNPLNWSGTSSPTPYTSTLVPNLRLGCIIDNSVAISPTATGSFVDGIWSGMMTAGEGASNVVLHADDGSHTGDSGPFDIAVKPDADGDGLPDAWETAYFGDASSCIATNDDDHDGQDNLYEYITGTDPANAASRFAVALGAQTNDGFVVDWNPVDGRMYDLLWSSDLMLPFQILEPAIPYPINSFTDSVHSASATGYYIVKVHMPSATDFDGDGLPDVWESDFFRHPIDAGAGDDPDGDGQRNIEEYIAGTDPTDAASRFEVNSINASTLLWTEQPGRTYSVLWTDDLAKPFKCIATALTSGSYIDSEPRSGTANYYRIVVEIE